ncbi:MAG: antibiotic biosynthesis monooxygenase [Geminicoccaceae bacterium]|nr:MAG: antibiotic biosynthesis monooxygenase [Geminicoccaceae bacterium]
MTVVVIARVEALPGHEAEVEALLRWQVGPTRDEKGCLNYDLHRDNAESTVFWFHETWSSEADLAAHAQAEHMVTNRARLKPLLATATQVHRLTRLA